MRRCLHSLLVGVLTFSLAIDAARACGHLRPCRPCAAAWQGPVVIVPSTVVWDGCDVVHAGCPVVVADDCGCGGLAGATVTGCPTGCEEIVCGAPLDCCGSSAAVTTAPATGVVQARPAPAAISPADHRPTPATPAEVAPAPESVERAPEPLATVPNLAPVAPASATEPEMPAGESSATATSDDSEAADEVQDVPEAGPPMDEPSVQPEPTPQPEPAPTPEPQPAPPRRNPFEEADAADAATSGSDSVDVPPVAPAREEVVPTIEPPPEERPPFDAPAAEPAKEPAAAAEPQRRWIDDTGSFAVVGRLVDVRGDTVEILRADGRSVTVPLVRLSGFDRDYLADAGPRVAAARQPALRPIDTAQR